MKPATVMTPHEPLLRVGGGTSEAHLALSVRSLGRSRAALMTLLLSLVLCILLALGAVSSTTAPASLDYSMPEPDLTVNLPTLGSIRGLNRTDYHLFLGIEYGNAGRFEPAWPVQAWAPRVLEATNYGPVCPSTSYDFSLEEDMHMKPNSVLGRKASAFWQVNESCLYLNIDAPVGAGVDQCLRVLVWFHGGSFIAGAGSDITSEDVSVLMLRGIVVVTVNSRLGAFGFLFSDTLHGPRAGELANLGFSDQRLALEFVAQHIKAFGGDPQRVTIMGWSSGASSVSAHLSMKKSQGLFHAAIMQSGGFAAWYHSKASAQAAFISLANCLGCTNEEQKGQCIRDVSTADIVTCQRLVGASSFAPVVDGVHFLYDSPADAIEMGWMQTDIPVIIGSAAYDGLSDFGLDATRAALHAYISSCFQDNETAVKKAFNLYDPGQSASPRLGWSASYWAFRAIDADKSLTCIARRVARRWARDGKSPAFWYQWSYDAPYGDKILQEMARKDRENLGRAKESADFALNAKVPSHSICWPCPGAGHGSEMPFLFRDTRAIRKKAQLEKVFKVAHLGATVPVDALIGQGLADAIQELWVHFVKNHSLSGLPKATPTGTPLPEWRSVSWQEPGAGPALVIEGAGLLSPLVDAYKAEKCNFWDTAPPLQC